MRPKAWTLGIEFKLYRNLAHDFCFEQRLSVAKNASISSHHTHHLDASIPVRWEVWCKLRGAIHNGAVAVGLPREATVARGGLGLSRATQASRGWSWGDEFGAEIDGNW
ncbi:unnamed protein product [Sphenostylis stenocarpa]|uniref:Uncharacterized protein n=1 Tax=Sphenostylis stenocarpa TaxID=92480 RepID=A0AA86STK8_9FABA|nr:unnamed protein product [Sphenostylis stenocarpa]